jgi:outer membrane protein assembly factor BamB
MTVQLRSVSLALVCAGAASLAAAENWPSRWGPSGNSMSGETRVPLRWSRDQGVRWKTPLPAPGNSCPIVWENQVIVTQSFDREGSRRGLLSFDRRDGRKLWEASIPFAGKESTHQDNPYCSHSPVTDGERVIALLGSAGILCTDMRGRQLWRKETGPLEQIWGTAASPRIHGNLVFFNCGPGDRTFLLALDKRTGREVWRVDEPGKYGHKAEEWMGSWSDPAIVRVRGRDELIMAWPGAVKAYDPATGRLLWTCRGLSPLVYTTPLVTPEVVVVLCGYGGAWMAVRPGGDGDVTETHRLWRHERASQRIGSGVIIGEHVYLVNEPGTAQCFEWRTGKEIFNERLGSTTWGSLVHAAGRLYSTSLRGETAVFAAKPQFEVLARNPLEERTMATPAISNGEIFIRTHEHLWCIQGS